MTPEEIQSALMATLDWDGGVQLHLTGGEPFLNYPLLTEAVTLATNMDIPRYVETNASWCVRHELVVERFEELKNLGLQAILISSSPFHAVKIPLNRTLIAIDSALQVFGPHNVMVYLPEWIDQIS